MRKFGRTVSRHVLGALGVVTLAFAGIGVFAGTGQAASPTLTVNPSTNLADGQQVTVTGTSLGVTGLVAVVECGNADSGGTPLPGSAPTSSDCYGAESVGTQTILVTVANDSATTPYTVHTAGIGANTRKCIAGGNFDCVIAMADVATQGSVLQIAAPITFAGSPSTTTAPGSTTTAATTTTTAGPTASTQPQVTSGPGAPVPAVFATGGAAIASGATTRPGATGTSSGTLPFTGLSPSVWFLFGTGLVLVDLGYLLWSATRPARRRGRDRA